MSDWLTNHFLIAPPNMPDGRFEKTVIYIAKHDAIGALGLVINRPLDVMFSDLLNDLEIVTALNTEKKQEAKNQVVLCGGPMRPEVGFVLHTGQPQWHSSVVVTENICLTTSKDILEAIANEQAASNYQICLGHASWQQNQLEAELAEGGWYVVPADGNLLFDTPYDEIWYAAAKKAGIHLNWLSDDIGHA